MNSLQTFTNRFAEIESGNPDLKQYRLGILQADLEDYYGIDMWQKGERVIDDKWYLYLEVMEERLGLSNA